MREPFEPPARLRGGGAGIDAPKPPDARKKDPKSKKKDLKEVKESWGKVDELDDRQKHDMAALGKQADALRNVREPKKKRRSERESLDPSIREILEKYCEFSVEQGHSDVSLQMQQALKELARQLQTTVERADCAEETLSSLQAQLQEQSSANKELDKERLSALQKVEELQLQALELQSQVEERHRSSERHLGQEERQAARQAQAAAQVARLEALLKEAILRGAKLSRAAAEAEAALNETERQKKNLEKSLERERRKRERGAHQRRLLETELQGCERRCSAAEARLKEYLQAASEGAEKVVEAHMQHLASAGTSLAAKVEEQAEVIQVLRSLLQDHKDFIRQQLGSELSLPSFPEPAESEERMANNGTDSAPPRPTGPPPPPPGIDAPSSDVDLHHDIARDIGQQVEVMILDAKHASETKVGKEITKIKGKMEAMAEKIKMINERVAGIEPGRNGLLKSDLQSSIAKLEEVWEGEVGTLKHELWQTIQAHNHNADLLKHHKDAIDQVQSRMTDLAPNPELEQVWLTRPGKIGDTLLGAAGAKRLLEGASEGNGQGRRTKLCCMVGEQISAKAAYVRGDPPPTDTKQEQQMDQLMARLTVVQQQLMSVWVPGQQMSLPSQSVGRVDTQKLDANPMRMIARAPEITLLEGRYVVHRHMLMLVWLSTWLLCAGADWIAWTGSEQHGSAVADGWQKVPRADQYEVLDWEVEGRANAYRFFYPGATHYTLGTPSSSSLVVHVWQPFSETAADAAVGANLRGALYGLYHRHLHRVVVNVSNVGWERIVTDPICEEGAVCPVALLIGTSQLPQRVASGRIHPLDDYLAAYLLKHLQRLPDEFQSIMYYDYYLTSRFMGIPFVTDVRLLGFNKTTLENLGLELPPPHGRYDWTWENLRDTACAITEKYGVGGLMANSDWDEDAKLFMLMVQAAHGALFRTYLGSDGPSRQCNLGTGRSAIDTFWKPMIQRGCLRSSGNQNYWGITGTSNLTPVLENAVDPVHPPDVSGFSNYNYTDARTLGFFISPGLEEELSYGRCMPSQLRQREAVGNCSALETLHLSPDSCQQRAFRLGADTYAYAKTLKTEGSEKAACEVLRCKSAGQVASWASAHPRWEIVSKHCSEILYATMPENLTYQGGSGLALTMRERGGEANQSCPNITALWEYDWLRNDDEPPPCWENAEGWRLISELIDLEKPYMRQANTLRDVQTLPPLKDLSSFGTSFWEPVITALLHGIPSQYPNSPIPQYAEVESLKPIRIALLRSIYGNVTPAESLREACSIVDEVLRPCNQSKWRTDPRCKNPRDGLQGCPEGFFYQETFEDFGLGCIKCPRGRYADERSVSLECKACVAGHFSEAIGSTSCRQCTVGTVAQQTGLSECIECPMGRAPLGTSWCHSCPPATYQSGPTCEPCPTGFTSIEESTSIRACTRKGSILLLNLLLVFFFVGLALLLPLLLGRPLPIDDIYMEDGCVVVKTWGGHRIARWSPVPLHIQLKHTQHPEVESRMGVFQAKVRWPDEVWLMDSKGAHVTDNINCSRGSLRLQMRSTFLGAVIGRLPAGLFFIWLCGCLGVLIFVLSENADAEAEVLPYVLAVLFLALGLALGGYWYWWRQGFETPLARKRNQWREKLLQRHKPVTSDRGPSRAIDAGKLCDFHTYFQEAIGKRNMSYVVSNLLLPLTKQERMSYAELAGPSPVNWFVSHCWSNGFADLVESLRRLAMSLAEPSHTAQEAAQEPLWREVSYWICSFSNNQWQLDEELGKGDPMASSFNQALWSPTCKGTAMVLDENAEALRRSWCLFEVFQNCKLTAERSDYEGLLMCTPAGVLQKGDASVDMVVVLARTLSKIKMEDATASKPEDKIMIDTCVQSLEGGFGEVNRFVRHCIKTALDEAHMSFEGHFAALVTALEQASSNVADIAGSTQSIAASGASLQSALAAQARAAPAASSKKAQKKVTKTTKGAGVRPHIRLAGIIGPFLIEELQNVRHLALFFSAPERGVCSLYGVLQCLVRDTIRGAEWSTIAQSAIDFVRAASLTGEIAADALETRVSIRSKIKKRLRTVKRQRVDAMLVTPREEEKHDKLMKVAQGKQLTLLRPKNAFKYPDSDDAVFPQHEVMKPVDFRAQNLPMAGTVFRGNRRKYSNEEKEMLTKIIKENHPKMEVLAGGGAVLAKTGKKVSVAEAELLATKVNRPEVVESVGELATGTRQVEAQEPMQDAPPSDIVPDPEDGVDTSRRPVLKDSRRAKRAAGHRPRPNSVKKARNPQAKKAT
ncbi:unnamed protein product [Symbiodinium sp. CCMP2456]|nr:unnamed protein product [Symbiodinium sp. CCMP2456]